MYKKIAKRIGKPIEIITENVMNSLKGYDWPGNIRELENVLERVVINSSGSKLHLIDELRNPTKNLYTSPRTMEAVERQYILEVLEMTNWKVSGKGGASDILGLDRSTLRARMLKLKIEKIRFLLPIAPNHPSHPVNKRAPIFATLRNISFIPHRSSRVGGNI